MPAFPCQTPMAWQLPDGGGVVLGEVGGMADGPGVTGGVGPLPPPNALLTALIRGYLK